MSFTTHHATSSHALPVLVSGGKAYGPGDALDRAATAAVAKMIGTRSAEQWRSQLPPAPPPARSNYHHPYQTIDDCFEDPREQEARRVRAWLERR